MTLAIEKQKSKTINRFFYEEIILLGRVFSDHQSEEDLMFRSARMLDWIYRRYTGQIGNFENQIITELLKQPYKPHPSTIYLLEKHFPIHKEKQDIHSKILQK